MCGAPSDQGLMLIALSEGYGCSTLIYNGVCGCVELHLASGRVHFLGDSNTSTAHFMYSNARYNTTKLRY